MAAFETHNGSPPDVSSSSEEEHSTLLRALRARRPMHDGTPTSSSSSTRNTGVDLWPLRDFFPGQPKSLSGIAIRSFCLGITTCGSLTAIIAICIFTDSPLWRAPFFLLALSLFHFLEFWTTAERNTAVANIDSFLLTANWPSYAVAHTAAFLECGIVGFFFPDRCWTLPGLPTQAPLLLGLVLVGLGQAVRTAAMLHAGASFNHQVQHKKADSHRLVTTGIYGLFRHPSYFGFFYWSLGTQLVLGNVVCFVAYAGVLWMFFKDRIRREESKLIDFFGQEYVQYRQRVGTKMPLVP